MRNALLLLCLPLLAQEPNARIEGRVIDSEGKPVANATVTTGLISDRQPRSLRTADDGTFVFDALTPATNYALTAQKPGFLPAALGAGAMGPGSTPPPPFALTAGETARVELRLIGQGVITGVITNQSGDPLAQATAVLWQVRYRLGVPEKNYVRVTRTDDRGVYRFAALPAGRYVVVAGETGAGSAREGEANLTTYFRGTQEFTDATPVNVTPGSELRADIALLRGAVHSMRGKVTDASGGPLLQARVSARRNNDAAFTTPSASPTDEDGNFEIHALMPGSYVVEPDAMFDSKTGTPLPRLAMSRSVTIGGADVNDVILRPSTTGSLKGTIHIEGAEWAPPAEKRRAGPLLSEQMLNEPAGLPGAKTPFAGLAAMGSPINGSYAAEVHADATFELSGVTPGEYRFIAGGFPETYYVKSVRIGDRDITNATVRVPGDPLTIVVSTKGAEVTGTLPHDGLSVALWPESDNPGHPLHGIRVINSTKDGGFALRGLAPGTYRIAAFDTSEPGVLWNYTFLNKFASEAKRIELREGAKAKAEPSLIPTDRFNEAFKQLP